MKRIVTFITLGTFLLLSAVMAPTTGEARYLRYEDGTRALTGLKGQPLETKRTIEREMELTAGGTSGIESHGDAIREALKRFDLSTLGVSVEDLSFELEGGRLKRIKNADGSQVYLELDYDPSYPDQVLRIKDRVNFAQTNYITQSILDDPNNAAWKEIVYDCGYQKTFPPSFDPVGKMTNIIMTDEDGYPIIAGQNLYGRAWSTSAIGYDMPSTASSGTFQNILDAIGMNTRSWAGTGHIGGIHGQVHTGGATPAGYANFDASKIGAQRPVSLVSYNYKDNGEVEKIHWGWSSTTHNGEASWAVRYAYRKDIMDADGNTLSAHFYDDPTPNGSCPKVTGNIVKDHEGNFFLIGKGNATNDNDSVIGDVTGKPLLIASVKRGQDAVSGSYFVYGGETNKFTYDALERMVGREVTMTGDFSAYASASIRRGGVTQAGHITEEDYLRYRADTPGVRDHQRLFGSGVKYQGQEAFAFYANSPVSWL